MSVFNRHMGIDLGTSNTLVFVRGKGIVVCEPSVVAIDQGNNVVAVGREAKDMIGKTPGHIRAIRPLHEGVIADFDITHKMIKYFITKALSNVTFLTAPKVVVGVPSQITEVEKRAVYDATMQAGAKAVFLIEEPMAAAIGAELEVTEPSGCMVVDIGGGTTEIAVISLGGIVSARSIRTAGDELDEAIINYVKRKFNVVIGVATAEKIKLSIGNAVVPKQELEYKFTGRNLVTGIPNHLSLRSSEVNEAIKDPIQVIIEGIKATLEKTPPEISADVYNSGVVLTGGGALLSGLDWLIQKETGLPVRIAENPLECVALGTAKAVESFDVLKNVFINVRGK